MIAESPTDPVTGTCSLSERTSHLFQRWRAARIKISLTRLNHSQNKVMQVFLVTAKLDTETWCHNVPIGNFKKLDSF